MALDQTVAKAKQKGADNPRGPRFKKVVPRMTNEQIAAIEALASLSPRALKITLLAPQHVAPMIVRGVKTMEGDRGKQRKLLKDKMPIDLTSPVSLPYVPPADKDKEVRYVAADVKKYLARVYGTVDRSFLRGARADDPSMRGFQSWMSMGAPADTWTFCVQKDGRPLSLAEAIATNRLTDDTVSLTLGEFSVRMSKAAKRLQAMADKVEIGKAARKPKQPPKERKERWTKPGGAL